MDYFVVEHRIPLAERVRVSSDHFFEAPGQRHLLITEERYEPPGAVDTPIVAVRGYVDVTESGTLHPEPVSEHERDTVAETIERFFTNDSEFVFDTGSVPHRFDLERAVFREPSVRSDTRYLARYHPDL